MPIEATMKEWSREKGIHVDTLRKRVSEVAGKVFEPRALVPAAIVFQAVEPRDLKAAQLRETEARAEKVELANAEKRRDLFPWHEVEKIIHQRFQLMADLFRSLPAEVSSKCNPSDPEHAYRVLDEFLQGRLPGLREDGKVANLEAGEKTKRKKTKKKAAKAK